MLLFFAWSHRNGMWLTDVPEDINANSLNFTFVVYLCGKFYDEMD